jgi:aliphatic nitrilase
MLERKHAAFSGIFGPDGRLIGDGLIDDEGIVYADIDLNACIQPKQMHDIVGHYNRFDVFSLQVNQTPQRPVHFITDDGTQPGSPDFVQHPQSR